jgi:hypothetical protein
MVVVKVKLLVVDTLCHQLANLLRVKLLEKEITRLTDTSLNQEE